MKIENEQSLTYDYQKLDEYLTKMMIDPKELDKYFRGIHTAFTTIFQFLFNADAIPSGYAFMDDQTRLRSLDEFFQILGSLEKKGGES